MCFQILAYGGLDPSISGRDNYKCLHLEIQFCKRTHLKNNFDCFMTSFLYLCLSFLNFTGNLKVTFFPSKADMQHALVRITFRIGLQIMNLLSPKWRKHVWLCVCVRESVVPLLSPVFVRPADSLKAFYLPFAPSGWRTEVCVERVLRIRRRDSALRSPCVAGGQLVQHRRFSL